MELRRLTDSILLFLLGFIQRCGVGSRGLAILLTVGPAIGLVSTAKAQNSLRAERGSLSLGDCMAEFAEIAKALPEDVTAFRELPTVIPGRRGAVEDADLESWRESLEELLRAIQSERNELDRIAASLPDDYSQITPELRTFLRENEPSATVLFLREKIAEIQHWQTVRRRARNISNIRRDRIAREREAAREEGAGVDAQSEAPSRRKRQAKRGANSGSSSSFLSGAGPFALLAVPALLLLEHMDFENLFDFDLGSKPSTEFSEEAAKLVGATKEELINRAKENVREDIARNQFAESHGKLLLAIEVSQHPELMPEYADMLFRYQQLVEEAKNIFTSGLEASLSEAEFLSRMNELRKYLFRLGLGNYCESNARMSDFFVRGCINCEGQTQVLISVIRDAGIQFPSSLQLGSQLFTDHIRAVLFKADTKELYDLIYGFKTTVIEGPVYKPSLSLWSFLNKYGEAREFSLRDDLLIIDQDSNVPASTNEYKFDEGTNTKLRFPKVEQSYFNPPGAGGRREPPEQKQIEYRDLGTEQDAFLDAIAEEEAAHALEERLRREEEARRRAANENGRKGRGNGAETAAASNTAGQQYEDLIKELIQDLGVESDQGKRGVLSDTGRTKSEDFGTRTPHTSKSERRLTDEELRRQQFIELAASGKVAANLVRKKKGESGERRWTAAEFTRLQTLMQPYAQESTVVQEFINLIGIIRDKPVYATEADTIKFPPIVRNATGATKDPEFGIELPPLSFEPFTEAERALVPTHPRVSVPEEAIVVRDPKLRKEILADADSDKWFATAYTANQEYLSRNLSPPTLRLIAGEDMVETLDAMSAREFRKVLVDVQSLVEARKTIAELMDASNGANVPNDKPYAALIPLYQLLAKTSAEWQSLPEETIRAMIVEHPDGGYRALALLQTMKAEDITPFTHWGKAYAAGHPDLRDPGNEFVIRDSIAKYLFSADTLDFTEPFLPKGATVLVSNVSVTTEIKPTLAPSVEAGKSASEVSERAPESESVAEQGADLKEEPKNEVGAKNLTISPEQFLRIAAAAANESRHFDEASFAGFYPNWNPERGRSALLLHQGSEAFKLGLRQLLNPKRLARLVGNPESRLAWGETELISVTVANVDGEIGLDAGTYLLPKETFDLYYEELLTPKERSQFALGPVFNYERTFQNPRKNANGTEYFDSFMHEGVEYRAYQRSTDVSPIVAPTPEVETLLALDGISGITFAIRSRFENSLFDLKPDGKVPTPIAVSERRSGEFVNRQLLQGRIDSIYERFFRRSLELGTLGRRERVASFQNYFSDHFRRAGIVLNESGRQLVTELVQDLAILEAKVIDLRDFERALWDRNGLPFGIENSMSRSQRAFSDRIQYAVQTFNIEQTIEAMVRSGAIDPMTPFPEAEIEKLVPVFYTKE